MKRFGNNKNSTLLVVQRKQQQQQPPLIQPIQPEKTIKKPTQSIEKFTQPIKRDFKIPRYHVDYSVTNFFKKVVKMNNDSSRSTQKIDLSPLYLFISDTSFIFKTLSALKSQQQIDDIYLDVFKTHTNCILNFGEKMISNSEEYENTKKQLEAIQKRKMDNINNKKNLIIEEPIEEICEEDLDQEEAVEEERKMEEEEEDLELLHLDE